VKHLTLDRIYARNSTYTRVRRNTDIGLKRSLLKLQQAIHTGYASKKNVRADFNFRRGDRKFCEICISIANKPY